MAARKRPAPKAPEPLFDFPCTTTWYPIVEDVSKIPLNVWCLLNTIDMEGEESLWIARWDGKLKVWLTSGGSAVEANEHAMGYSPIFTAQGVLWKYE